MKEQRYLENAGFFEEGVVQGSQWCNTCEDIEPFRRTPFKLICMTCKVEHIISGGVITYKKTVSSSKFFGEGAVKKSNDLVIESLAKRTSNIKLR